MLAAAVLAAIVAARVDGGPRDLLAPTGTDPVGRRVVHWVDGSRSEVLSAVATHRREVTVYIWYPSSTRAPATATYVDGYDKLTRALSPDEASLVRATVTHAGVGVAPAATPSRFPLILLSPGAGSLAALYTTIGEELASHGYVVAAVDHPYDSKAVVLADGRVATQAKPPADGEAFLQHQRDRVTVRAEDLRFVLEQLTRLETTSSGDPLAGRLDVSRIGALGHSVGGMTAAELCMRDIRLRACANLDGVVAALPVYPDASGNGPSQPFLFVDKPFSAVRGETANETARRTGVLRQRGNATLSNVQRGRSYRVTLARATHATFSDEEVLTTNTTVQRQLLSRVRTYVTAFFDEALRGERAAVLVPARTDEAIVEVFTPR